MNNSVFLNTQEASFDLKNVTFSPNSIRLWPFLAPVILGSLLNLSNPSVIVPVMENSKQVVSSNTSEFSLQILSAPVARNKIVGRKISRQEASAITCRILQKAEQARIDAAKIEARYAVSLEQS